MKKLWDLIWYNGGRGPEGGNNYWRRFTAAHFIYVGTALALMSAAVGALSMVVGAVYPGLTDQEFMWTLFHEPVIVILNLLPVLLLTAGLYFATGRAWIAYLGSSLTVLALSIVDFYKLVIRSETFVASDLGLVGEAVGIISNYTIVLSGRAWACILAVVLGTVFCAALMPGRLRGLWVRLPGAVVSFAVLITLILTVYTSDTVYNKVENKEADVDPWVEQQVYASKGFLYSFLHSISDALPQKPEGYDQDTARALLAGYEEGEIPEDRRVNVIAVMFEAYTDLSEYPGAGVREDVYAPLHELQAESLHGHIISNVFAGGTINTERNFLTGYTESGEYRSPTDSYVYFLRRNGYYAEGLHTGDGWFYNRENVERNLGMEKYYFLDDYNSGDRSDRFFFSHLTELVEGRDRSKPYFNFSITYQNHGAYIDTYTCEESYIDPSGLTDAQYNTVNNYLEGIADTSRRMLDFVNSLRDDPEPFVVVFFGDHKPYLGTAYEPLGINIDLGTEDGFYNYYSTPYIIWANDAARSATGGSFTGEGGDISSCFLMDEVFTQCGWGRSAYGELLHSLRRRVSVVNTGSDAAVVDGVLCRELTGDAKELVDSLRWAEYYTKHSFSYDDVTGE